MIFMYRPTLRDLPWWLWLCLRDLWKDADAIVTEDTTKPQARYEG